MKGNEATMLDMVMGLPEQMAEALERSGKARLGRIPRPQGVTVAGMGGSAIGGDLARDLLRTESPVPIATNRDYAVPASLGPRSLFVAVSYSGNTEETLSAYRAARRSGCTVAVISSGGRLAASARRSRLPLVTVPGGFPPRAALGHLFVSLLVLLERAGLLHRVERRVGEAVSGMVDRRQVWRRRAKLIAKRLRGRLPVVYSTTRLLDAVADRWRCQLNENAKVVCHTNRLPEHNHNEVVGMGRPGFLAERTAIVSLLDRGTHRRTALRLKNVLSIARGGYADALTLQSEGRGSLARMMSLVMLGDLVSVELAGQTGVDPLPVVRIDELKRRLARAKK